MKNLFSASRLSLIFVLLAMFLLHYESAYAYTFVEANNHLNNATAELDGGNCSAADRRLDQADVTIDQILRNRTMRGCRSMPLNDLENLARRLSNLGGRLQRQCGMRRSYDNTLEKVRSWQNTPLCGAQNKQQRCQQYANTAVRQHQINIKKGCGYTGNRWSDKYQGHYRWCMNVSENSAHQETEARNIFIDNCAVPGACNRFIGSWKWFNGITVQISADYRFSSSGNSGTWRCLPNGQIELRWKNGGWVDTVSISPDGNSMSGKNQHGTTIKANRKQQGMLYDVQSGPYGGGRICLTSEEAKRIKNDPNTRKITPVGIPCNK